MSIRKKYPTDFKAKVVLEILKEEKSVSQLSSEYGIHPSILNRWRNMVIEKLPSFFTDEQKNLENIKAQYEKQIQDLYAEVGHLTTELTWLKKRVASEFNRDERISLVEWGHPELSIKKQAELLSLNRSSLYYQPVPPSPEEIAIKHRIHEIYTVFPFYGSRRITAQLRKEGFLVNRKAVQRHMREMGLIAIYPGPNLSRRNQEHRIYPYLLRNLDITRPEQVWGIDITYIRLVQGWMYLIAIIDWYSRFVVGWALDQCLATTFVLQAVEEALARARPEIMNSDQGSQFTNPEYINLLQSAGIKISMDGKGRAIDNIFTERLWRSLKYEEVYLNEYSSPREARRGIARYLEFYNYRRIHQSLEYKTPAEVYFYTKDEAKCISIL